MKKNYYFFLTMNTFKRFISQALGITIESYDIKKKKEQGRL